MNDEFWKTKNHEIDLDFGLEIKYTAPLKSDFTDCNLRKYYLVRLMREIFLYFGIIIIGTFNKQDAGQ